jgi:hypothetical protein
VGFGVLGVQDVQEQQWEPSCRSLVEVVQLYSMESTQQATGLAGLLGRGPLLLDRAAGGCELLMHMVSMMACCHLAQYARDHLHNAMRPQLYVSCSSLVSSCCRDPPFFASRREARQFHRLCTSLCGPCQEGLVEFRLL